MIKRLLILILVLLASSSSTYAQCYWVKQIGEGQTINPISTVLDDNNNSYITGFYTGTVDVDPGPAVFNLTANPYSQGNVFISKYDKDGNFIWAKSIEADSNKFVHARAITISPNSLLYINGFFSGKVDFKPGTDTFHLIPKYNYSNYILKLDTAGNFIWAKKSWDQLHESQQSIPEIILEVDQQENTYQSGTFNDSIDVDPSSNSALVYTTNGSINSFIIKLDANGNYLWSKHFKNNEQIIPNYYQVNTELKASVVDLEGNILLGICNADVYNNDTISVNNLIKIDPLGNIIWSKDIVRYRWDDVNVGPISDLAIDRNNNLIVFGSFMGKLDVNTDTSLTYWLSSYRTGSAYVAKYNSNGEFLWANKFASAEFNNHSCYGNKTCHTDAANNIYLSGCFTSTADLDPGIGVYNATTAESSSSYMIKLNAGGQFLGAKVLPSEIKLAIDNNQNIFTAGTLNSNFDFDLGPQSQELSPNAGFFIYKIFQDSIGPVITALSSTTICYEDSVTLSSNLTSGNYWINGSSEQQVTAKTEGNYHVVSSDGACFPKPSNQIQVTVNDCPNPYPCFFAKKIGEQGVVIPRSIALDDSSNTYITGSFADKVDFNPGEDTLFLNSHGNQAIFVCKFNAEGKFCWAKSLGSHGSGIEIKYNKSGFIYVSGSYSIRTDFNPGIDTFYLGSENDNNSKNFICKFNINGDFIWAKSLIYNGEDIWFDLDQNENIYLCDRLIGTIDCDPGPNEYNLSASNPCIFITKLDNNGNFFWAKQYSDILKIVEPKITIDNSNNILLTSSADSSMLIAKFDLSGNKLWQKEITSPSFIAARGGIITDNTGDIYTSGLYLSRTDFDPGLDTFYLNYTGGEKTFILKLNQDGSFLWAKSLSGSNGGGIQSRSIKLDTLDNVYTSGFFARSIDFDPGDGVYNLIDNGMADVFISKLDSSGNFVWAKQLGGANEDLSFSIDLDKNGDIYSTGYFSYTAADFDPGPGEFLLKSSTNATGFLSMIKQSLDVPIITNSHTDTICQGDSIVLSSNTTLSATWSTGATSSSITVSDSGTYWVTVSADGCSPARSAPVQIVVKPTHTASLVSVLHSDSQQVCLNSTILPIHYKTTRVNGIGTGINMPAGVNAILQSDTIKITGAPSINGDYHYKIPIIGECKTDTLFGTIVVQSKPQATISIIGDTTFCEGDTILFSVNPSANFNYQWQNNGTNINGATSTLYNATASGSYAVIVSSSAICADTSSAIFVNSTNLINPIFSNISPICQGDLFTLSDTSNNNVIGQWLPEPNYNQTTLYTFTPASGQCADTVQITIVVNPAPRLVTSYSRSDCGTDNAYIRVDSVVGGIAPFTYQLNNNTVTPVNSLLSNLQGNNYVLRVRGNNNCSDTSVIAIAHVQALNINLSASNVTCSPFNNSTVNASVTGSTTPYLYNWIGNYIDNSSYNITTGGTYTCEVIDKFGCTLSNTINVIEPAPIQITITSTNTQCGLSEGSATALVVGGTAPYIYQWSSGSHQPLADSLSSGMYMLQVYDANSCNSSASINIISTDGPAANLINLKNTTCNDTQDGSLLIEVIPDRGVPPITYVWNTGETSTEITNLAPGYYYLTMTDANECNAIFTYTIQSAPAPTTTFNVVRPDCGAANGSITAIVSNGVEPYEYMWFEGSQGSGSNAAVFSIEPEAINLSAGPYTFEVYDGKGCLFKNPINLRSITNDFTIMVNNITPSNCHSSPNGAADISVEGGVAPYTYSWSNGTTSEDLTNVNAGTYFLSVTDANRCVAIEGVVVPSVLQNLQYRQQLCIVTVDTATSKNLIIWEKNQQEGIKNFKIYRETANNNYQLLTSLPFNALSEFTDPIADVDNHSWRYRITAVDSCGEETPYSSPHKTIHLVQNDLSSGGFSLSWDYYDGSNYSSFDIWRELPSAGWEKIVTLPGTTTSYTDLSTSDPGARYMIEVTLTNSCESTAKGIAGPKGTATTVVKSKSNIRNNRNIAPLPVNLLRFNALCKNNQVELTWATLSETNNDYFDVERSSDAITYTKVARVNGKGNTTDAQHYKLYDEEPLSGISYYRLRQVDYNGSTKLLTPAVANCEIKTDISISPNPSKGIFEISGLGIHQEVEITDALGKTVYRSLSESNTMNVDLHDINEGVYFVKIKNKTGILKADKIVVHK
jgi:hypothetical protein